MFPGSLVPYGISHNLIIPVDVIRIVKVSDAGAAMVCSVCPDLIKAEQFERLTFRVDPDQAIQVAAVPTIHTDGFKTVYFSHFRHDTNGYVRSTLSFQNSGPWSIVTSHYNRAPLHLLDFAACADIVSAVPFIIY